MSTDERSERLRAMSKAAQRMSRPSLFMRALIAERAGLHVTDAECLDYILDLKQTTATELARAMHLSKSTVTSMLDRLERSGFITRFVDRADRRRILIQPNMETIGARIRPFYLAYGEELQKLVSQYTDEELRFLTSHYERMTALYERQIEKLANPSNNR